MTALQLRHLLRAGLFGTGLWLASGAAALSTPLDDALNNAGQAETRLDFATALDQLATAIALAPDAAAPYLQRADLHVRMNRPGLALNDLSHVLDADPENLAARIARGDLLLKLGAISRALADYDAALALAPDNLTALSARARARTRAGLTSLALADYDHALALDPGNAGLTAARATLVAGLSGTGAAPVRYDPAALMEPAFRVSEGDTSAPTELIIVHAGNALANEAALLPRAALRPALETGALRITHLFTYTGQDSAIWANLALICAGQTGFAAVYEALAGEEAAAAVRQIDTGGGREAFDALVARSYAAAGLAQTQVQECAFSRGKAVRYLADWSDKRDGPAWRGASIYDRWPVFVLDGAVVSAGAVAEALSDIAAPAAALVADSIATDSATRHADPVPGPKQAPEADTSAEAADGPDRIAPVPEPASEPVSEPASGPATETGSDTVAEPEVESVAVPDPEPAEAGPAPKAPETPVAEDITEPEARIPPVLKGIWAPSLADCIAYTDAIAAPASLSAALPGLNPLDGPLLGTVLLTSRRMLLFNAAGTDCRVTETDLGDAEAPWRARLACTSPLAPGLTTALELTRLPDAGPAPSLSARFAGHDGLTLLQCRALGQLSRDFAPLWQIEPEACRVRAALDGATVSFIASPEGGLRLALESDRSAPGAGPLSVALDLDGKSLGAPSTVTRGGGWNVALGPVTPASQRLARGLLLQIRLTGDGGAQHSYLLPLLGSEPAMAALAPCGNG